MLIAQLSDPHVSLPGGVADARFATGARLDAAVRHLLTLSLRPDVVIVSGDCVDGGTAAEYEHFRERMRPLPMPWYVVPGNHDDRAAMRAAFGAQGRAAMDDFVQYVVESGPVRIVALDTHVPGAMSGRLCDARLGWLDARLREEPGKPTLVFMHHPPFRTGIPALDDLGLEDLDAFADVIARHPQVECVTSGHFHRSAQRRLHRAIAMICPSVAMQIALDLSRREPLGISNEPPACLLHAWDARTGLVTHLSPIPA